jgi:hypothetical protein
MEKFEHRFKDFVKFQFKVEREIDELNLKLIRLGKAIRLKKII